VCPWNRKAPPAREPGLKGRADLAGPDLLAWLAADDPALAQMVKGTALSRARRSGLLRNAALVVGERRDAAAVPALARRLADADPVVRGAAAWALGRIGTEPALNALRAACNDPDPVSRQAVHRALRLSTG
jgi:epoxyqueuosine reductase